MTVLVALGPLAFTAVLVLLLMEFGPERSVLAAAYWLVASLVFAIAMPLMRRRGRTRTQASIRAAIWAIVITIAVFVGLLFGYAPRVGAAVAVDAALSPQRADTGAKSPAAGSAADQLGGLFRGSLASCWQMSWSRRYQASVPPVPVRGREDRIARWWLARSQQCGTDA